MTRRIYLTLFTLLCVIATALAQTSVDVSVPRRATVGTPFSITIEVTNPEGAITTPRLPDLPGCRLLMENPSVSTSQQIYVFNGNRQSTQIKSYTYTILAEEESTIKVPSITVTIGGKEFTTQPKQFNVNAASANQERRNRNNHPFAGFPFDEEDFFEPTPVQHPSATRNNDFKDAPNELFMTFSLSASKVYEQQPVECAIKVYSVDQRIEHMAATGLPTFDGCLIESIDQPQTIEWRDEMVNGRQMYSAVVYRALLYPQRAGEIELKGVDYNVTIFREVYVQDFMTVRVIPERKQITLKPRDSKIQVTALPQPRPATFSGAVGKFSATSDLKGSNFKTNEAATVTYTFKGTGNIKFFTPPSIDFPSEFEVYEPNIVTNTHVSGSNMTGTQTVEYTFVPQNVGDFHIGDLEFTYFNPNSGKYETQIVEGYDISVEPGASVSTTTMGNTNKRDIQTKNTDIRHIEMGADRTSHTPSYIANSTLYWLLYPILSLLLIIGIITYNHTQHANPEGRRIKGAGKAARKHLAKAGKYLKAQQLDEYYAELLRAMQYYLTNKLSISGSQFSRENVIDALSRIGATEELKKQVINILDDCEMARYTPQTSGAAELIYDIARNAINEIERLKA